MMMGLVSIEREEEEKNRLDWMVMMDEDGPRQRHAAAGEKMTPFDSFDSKPCTYLPWACLGGANLRRFRSKKLIDRRRRRHHQGNSIDRIPHPIITDHQKIPILEQ
jgi:hypothetical protein